MTIEQKYSFALCGIQKNALEQKGKNNMIPIIYFLSNYTLSLRLRQLVLYFKYTFPNETANVEIILCFQIFW